MESPAFATLTPANVLARLAFSDAYDVLTASRQSTHADDARARAFHRMNAGPQQEYDDDVLRLRLEVERRHSQQDRDGETSDSLTEPDTDTEHGLREYGMIWIGHFVLGFEPAPSMPELGWMIGKVPIGSGIVVQDLPRNGLPENIPGLDILLCTRSFAKKHSIDIRNPHARFSFARENRAFFIAGCSRSQLAQLAVNGDRVQRELFALNQHRMNIRVDKLEYILEYTDFAKTRTFVQKRLNYLTRIAGAPNSVIFEVPTPLRNTRTIGQWTLGEPLGRGAHGRVFLATNTKNEMAAVKMVERDSKAPRVVDNEIATNKAVTSLAEKWDDGGRIVRQTEILYFEGDKSSSKAAFDEIAIVLQPMTPQTFHDLVGARSKGGHAGMSMDAAGVFRDALLGVKVMHDQYWLHGDLKPANIGIIGQPPRSVLLDVGTSARLGADATIQPTPGVGGTVGYLAPERELQEYDRSIDIWAMGIIGYELTYGYHPWKYSVNPWREGKENEKLQPLFREDYAEVIKRLARHYQSARLSPTRGYIHLGALLVDMLRYPWAANNHKGRIDIDDVLKHPNWGPLLPSEERRAKRVRHASGMLDDGEA